MAEIIDIEDLIYKTTMLTASFPRVSVHIRRKFCTDVSLVVLGIRTAYLLDVFSLSETIASNLADALYMHDLSPLKNLRIVYHRDLSQTFFVNTHLLEDRIKEARSTEPWTSFVTLNPEPILHPGTPPDILSTSDSILSASSPFVTSVSSRPVPHMIALAGFLLEYPFSYMPINPEHVFLQDVPLRVVECFISSTRSIEHLFMKCSYPLGLRSGGDDEDLTFPGLITARFKNRLDTTGRVNWTTVKVTCETRLLDRVAL